jgi:glycyl-tRNA synthetase
MEYMSNRQNITRIAKKRGFFFQTAKNHGSIGGLYSLGPTGAEVYRNILQNWKQEFVRKQGFQEVRSPTILPESVFDASGHLGSFDDAMVKCDECNSMHRSDKVIEREGSYNRTRRKPTLSLRQY